MVENMKSLAMAEDQNRDLATLRRSLDNLTDNTELQLFIEGIPGFMVSGDIPPHSALSMLADLFQDNNWALLSRIQQLLSSCDKMLEPSQRQKRLTACLTSTWMLGYMFTRDKIHYRSFRPFSYLFENLVHQIAAVPRTSSTMVEYWARCTIALLVRVIIRHLTVAPGDDLVNSIISRIPTLKDHVSARPTPRTRNHVRDTYNLEEVYVLAFTCLFVSLLECPIDLMSVARHPQERPDNFDGL
jgi:hypothetical protein